MFPTFGFPNLVGAWNGPGGVPANKSLLAGPVCGPINIFHNGLYLDIQGTNIFRYSIGLKYFNISNIFFFLKVNKITNIFL